MSETLPFDALRAVLEQQGFQAASAAGVAAAHIEIDGYPFVQPTEHLWVKFCYGTGKTFPAECGAANKDDALDRTIGFYQFDILAPENSGNGPATQVGDKLRKAFKYQQWQVADIGHVKTDTGNINPIDGAPRGFKRFVLRGALDFWHRG